MPQKKAQKERSLAEIIEELTRKVLQATRKLHTQSAPSSFTASEQPALVSPSADGGPDIPGAERPDIRMVFQRILIQTISSWLAKDKVPGSESKESFETSPMN